MCGIAGIFQYRNDVAAELNEHVGLRMTDALVHRGPDSGGLLVGPHILLGHRRLAILDLSQRGHQPMSDDQQQCWISYNGEVYNFPELRRELEECGHHFHSHTDTEVILRGYLEWGHAVAQRLDGMFAFAVWDRRDASLWLVRDPLGIKPLFYADDGRAIRFGSEIKAILADPQFHRRPDLEGLDAFLTLGYAPAPLTGFEHIRQLLPGHWLLAKAAGVSVSEWYRLPYPDRPPRDTAADAVARLDDAIQHSVQRQMISDVPLGAMLSGGLDSSAIVRAMSRDEQATVESFTIRFEEQAFDESPYAARVGERYGTHHHAETVAAESAAFLPVLVAHAEEPLADNSMLPFYLLAKFVRQRVKVALSGDGADELLGGYDTYRASRWAPRYRLVPRPIRRALVAPFVAALPPSEGKYGWTSVLRRFVEGAEQPGLRAHCSWRRMIPQHLRARLYTPSFLQAGQQDPLDRYATAAADAPPWLSPLEQQLHADLRFHLPNDMLVKVDRMSMAHALEVRVPLLDQQVVRACLNLPPHWKRRGREGKRVLRELLRADLPADVVDRRKAGFLIPLEKWLRGAWQPMLRQLLTPAWVHDCGLLQWAAVEHMLNAHAARRGDYAYPLFVLLVMSLWWRIWITGDMAEQRPRITAAPTRVTRLALAERDP